MYLTIIVKYKLSFVIEINKLIQKNCIVFQRLGEIKGILKMNITEGSTLVDIKH